jgi:putative ABC transport system permease protein
VKRPIPVQLFAVALWLYPPAYRREVGHNAVSVFGNLYADARGSLQRAGVVASTGRGYLAGLLPAWWDEVERRSRNAALASRGGGARMRFQLRSALRSLSRDPAFALVVILLLALGTGATTTMITVVDAVLLESLPYPDAEQLLSFSGGHSAADVQAWRERASTLTEVSGARANIVSVTGSASAFRARSGRVTEGFLKMFGATALRGRLMEAQDFVAQRRVAVLSQGAWERVWGGTREILGTAVSVDGTPYEVVGIVPYEFTPPERLTGSQIDIWIPILESDGMLVDPSAAVLRVGARMKSGTTLAETRSAIDLVQNELATELPEYHLDENGRVVDVAIRTLGEATTSDIRTPLLILLFGASLLLLAACANAAGLFLARGVTRKGEWAVRSAMGASQSTVMWGVITEGVVLAGLGSILGLATAKVGVGIVHDFDPGMLPRYREVGLDLRVLLWTASISLLTAVLFGALPAWRAAGIDPATALRGTRGGTAKGTMRLQRALVVGEVAVTTVLLLSAGLLLRSFSHLTQVDMGFAPEGALYTSVPLGRSSPPAARVDVVDRLTARLAAIPGVESVGGGITAPMEFTGGGRCCFMTEFTIDGVERDAVWLNPVTPGYFRALGIDIEAGRALGDEDADRRPMPIVISSGYAHELFGDGDPLGRQVNMTAREPTVAEIVGIAADVHQWGPADPADHFVYSPWRSQGSMVSRFAMTVRVRSIDESMVAAIRNVMAATAPEVAVDLRPYPEVMTSTTSKSRFYALLLGIFAASALMLAGGGLLSTLLYHARQRRKEVGIRLALGADSGRVARLVLRDALVTVAAGATFGGLIFPAVGRLLRAMLFEVGAADPWTLAGVAGMLVVTTALASYVPARLVAGTDPASVMKED